MSLNEVFDWYMWKTCVKLFDLFSWAWKYVSFHQQYCSRIWYLLLPTSHFFLWSGQQSLCTARKREGFTLVYIISLIKCTFLFVSYANIFHSLCKGSKIVNKKSPFLRRSDHLCSIYLVLSFWGHFYSENAILICKRN